MSMPSRRPSRSSMMTCNWSCTSSFLVICNFFSSISLVSFPRSPSSAEEMTRMRSSSDWTFTSHFCFSACRSTISSDKGLSMPSACRSFIRLISTSMVSRFFSISSCCCWSLFTSSCILALSFPLPVLSSATFSTSALSRPTSEFASAFSALASRPARSVSTCLRSSATRPSASAAARWRSSSCAVRSCNAARSCKTCCDSSPSFASCRCRSCLSSSSFS
mmetsp:Transcript_43090/g.116181  ORF Transcript_43090/g.116181 Transcript_43090/m.116181 type:complete len:220 (-) Transcript_43090:1298-1957(-)